jgi:hypothetical protein
MFKFTKPKKRHLAASCGSLFIGAFMLCGIVEIAVTPNSSIAASDRSKEHLDRPMLIPANLVAGDPGKPIVNTSGPSEIALAKHLRKKGAKMHGAFWCGYCGRQKELFGQQAFAKLQYIECDTRGINPQPQVCNRAGVNGFPTWTFSNGKTFAGLASLSALADASGYTGPRNFKN